MKKAFFALFILLLVSTNSMAAPRNGMNVSAAEYGDKWPLSVPSGEIFCSGHGVATFKTNGVSYALNGTAKTAGYQPINGLWVDDMKMVKEIEAQMDGKKLKPPYPKKNIGVLSDRALKLCEK